MVFISDLLMEPSRQTGRVRFGRHVGFLLFPVTGEGEEGKVNDAVFIISAPALAALDNNYLHNSTSNSVNSNLWFLQGISRLHASPRQFVPPINVTVPILQVSLISIKLLNSDPP